ncbi:methyl-accepting chemotaxis protein [Erythrobacter litoralis]|uniref:Putative chemotaxis protein n=1 Tax=Erythrobacter litoralis (strain HTCC2594) TaxID=314225 RepID=Q2NAL1_ERYLH|nr:methyl-accepting chemotaxis protein [Erythrobacter litoralis]ABC63280.1 putative chemotaxis protein [Erythrobacter litoralis HTCC2594]
MEHSKIIAADQSALELIPGKCGDVTVGCTDVAGVVEAVIASSEKLREEHTALQGTISDLEADQAKVSEASDEARLLSERAIARLGDGNALIRSSLSQITELLELVDTLTKHVTGFASAMDQVKRSSQHIDDIAETTNILALNATIEAMRAGEAGRAFAVVADEVKSLAGATRKATEEISSTIDTLEGEAKAVIGKIEGGAKASSEAKTSVAKIEETISGVSDLVEEVDRQNDQIARATNTISGHVSKVQGVLTGFDSAAIENEQKLQSAHSRMEALELTASEMFDSIVKSGLSPKDSEMVVQAQDHAAQLAEVAEAAIAVGEITMEELFDTHYRPVDGSNPPRYRSNASDWADRNWRPIIDAMVARGGAIMMCSPADMNGFLPTHVTDRSRQPTGDLAHDTKYCRNGRILLGPIDRKAKQSSAPYMMAVYRQEGDGKQYNVVRNVYVPLYINGRRWGDSELAYRF